MDDLMPAKVTNKVISRNGGRTVTGVGAVVEIYCEFIYILSNKVISEKLPSHTIAIED
jgi:hypothetical protein